MHRAHKGQMIKERWIPIFMRMTGEEGRMQYAPTRDKFKGMTIE